MFEIWYVGRGDTWHMLCDLIDDQGLEIVEVKTLFIFQVYFLSHLQSELLIIKLGHNI